MLKTIAAFCRKWNAKLFGIPGRIVAVPLAATVLAVNVALTAVDAVIVATLGACHVSGTAIRGVLDMVIRNIIVRVARNLYGDVRHSYRIVAGSRDDTVEDEDIEGEIEEAECVYSA